MPANPFDERIARTYEAKWPELFDPAVIEPVVDFRREAMPLFGQCRPGHPGVGELL